MNFDLIEIVYLIKYIYQFDFVNFGIDMYIMMENCLQYCMTLLSFKYNCKF